MPKHKTLAKLVDEAAVLMQKWVRMKAADANGYCVCVTCGKSHHWKEMDGGHFISRKYTATKIVEENIHPQCRRCNGWPDNFTHEAYETYMVDMYGKDFVDELKALARMPKKWPRDEVQDLIKQLKARISECQ